MMSRWFIDLRSRRAVKRDSSDKEIFSASWRDRRGGGGFSLLSCSGVEFGNNGYSALVAEAIREIERRRRK